MSVKFRLDMQGLSGAFAQLNKVMDKAQSSIMRTGNFVAQSTAQRAKNEIRSPGRSGKQYSFRGGLHTASAPGEPPADMTGVLANSISHTKMTDNPNSFATAGSNLAYATVLEFGGMNDDGNWVAARPFFFPAFLEAVAQAQSTLEKEFRAGR